jgi:hypothetical protein
MDGEGLVDRAPTSTSAPLSYVAAPSLDDHTLAVVDTSAMFVLQVSPHPY